MHKLKTPQARNSCFLFFLNPTSSPSSHWCLKCVHCPKPLWFLRGGRHWLKVWWLHFRQEVALVVAENWNEAFQLEKGFSMSHFVGSWKICQRVVQVQYHLTEKETGPRLLEDSPRVTAETRQLCPQRFHRLLRKVDLVTSWPCHPDHSTLDQAWAWPKYQDSEAILYRRLPKGGAFHFTGQDREQVGTWGEADGPTRPGMTSSCKSYTVT